MKHSIVWIAGCAISAFAGMAQADCAEDIARITGNSGMSANAAAPAEAQHGSAEGIAKDGSHAPMENAATDQNAAAGATGQTSTSGSTESAASSGSTVEGGITKDGSLAPLEGATESGTEVAMSGQDVQAQQEGQPTAAQQADSSASGGDREALIAEARTAMEAGNEEACRHAVEQIESM